MGTLNPINKRDFDVWFELCFFRVCVLIKNFPGIFINGWFFKFLHTRKFVFLRLFIIVHCIFAGVRSITSKKSHAIEIFPKSPHILYKKRNKLNSLNFFKHKIHSNSQFCFEKLVMNSKWKPVEGSHGSSIAQIFLILSFTSQSFIKYHINNPVFRKFCSEYVLITLSQMLSCPWLKWTCPRTAWAVGTPKSDFQENLTY